MPGLCGRPRTAAPEYPGVKLLFDQNLSHRVVAPLFEAFPECAHVRDFNLQRADDGAIWDFAKNNGFTIVSKDEDFHQRSFLHGHPPKVVWLRLGNCSTDQVVTAIRRNAQHLATFEADPEASFLIVSW